MRNNALSVQVGGSHYKNIPIQPVEFIEYNGLSFCEGNVIKYIVRSRKKNGLQDLEKAGHYLDILVQLQRTKPMPIITAPLAISLNKFLDQFPELTQAERDVVRIVSTWRRSAPTKETLLKRVALIADLSRGFHRVIDAWKNANPSSAER